MTNDKQLNNLISMLYEAAIDPSLFSEALSFCGQYVDAASGVFLTVNKKSAALPVLILKKIEFSSRMENSYTNQTINTDQLLNMFPDTTIEEWQCCYHAYNQNFVDCYKSYQDTSIYLDTILSAVVN